jgi:hypothetical protein
MRSSLRCLLSAAVAACFALSAFTWGWMPGCAPAAAVSAAHGIHGHAAHASHAHQPGVQQGNNGCTVHLCCIQLATTSADHTESGRFSHPERGTGSVAATPFVLLRASHSLPFAQAPPITSA